MSRGQGRVYRRIKDGQELATWWLDYTAGGKRYRESSETTVKKEAIDKLADLLGGRKAGKIIGRPDKMTVHELRELHEADYDAHARSSKEAIIRHWTLIEEFFGAGASQLVVTPTRLKEYAKARLAKGVSRQTVKNELSSLRAGFNLAIEEGLLAVAPHFALGEKVDRTRTGFFEDADFAAFVIELPEAFRPVVQFLRITGWRASEPLQLTWAQIDRDGETIRLYETQTKAHDARVFPYGSAPDLKALIEAQWQVRNGPFVFQQEGKEIKYAALYWQWYQARKRVGSDRIIHDLRRSAARDMMRAGMSEGVIMKLCGWRTRDMFDRYNIIDEARLAAEIAKRYGTPAAHSAPSRGSRSSRRNPVSVGGGSV